MQKILLACFLFVTHTVTAMEFAKYNATDKNYALAGNVYFYEEQFNEQLPHEALELLQKGYFTQAKSARLSLGFTTKAIWIAIPFEASTEKSERLVLEITSLIDVIQFYSLTEHGLIIDRFLTGRDFLVATRPIIHPNFVFPITMATSQRGLIFLRIRSQGSLLLPLSLSNESDFYAKNHSTQLVFGIYFGTMIIMVLYNLFLYAATRERTYAFFVFFAFFFLFLQLVANGFFQELVTPNHPRIATFALPVSQHLTTIFLLLFATQFFKAEQTISKLYKVAGYLSFFTFLVLLAGGFLPYRWFMTLGVATYAIATFLTFTMTLILLFYRKKIARLFLLANFLLCADILFSILVNIIVFDFAPYIRFATLAATAMAVIVLSLAIADKMTILRSNHAD